MDNYEKIVPDTSAIIDGLLTRIIGREISVEKILIHNAVIFELENQANEERTKGILGLEEITKLHKLKDIDISFEGQRPKYADIRYANLGEIDARIRELAYEEGAVLITLDNVQALAARSKGIKVLHYKPAEKKRKLSFENLFDDKTMSLHLKEDMPAIAKRGSPGSWKIVKLGKVLTAGHMKSLSREIIESAEESRKGFIESENKGGSIIQLYDYRIVITNPPFSDTHEITIVRPIKKMTLEEYGLSEELTARIIDNAEGVLVAGSPGHGKTTFGRALAEEYASRGKIVKTIESPRDMLLSDSITQYNLTKENSDEIKDVLLLTRPDNTLFDEMRNIKDFLLYSDMRLAGVGMVGITHASTPIDAVQRFIGRIELGVIPHVIDTIIFIKEGNVSSVLKLDMVVKVPSGMTESDLARPVVLAVDFFTGKPEYEIYSYGESTVVMPVSGEKRRPILRLAEEGLKKKLEKKGIDAVVEFISDSSAAIYLNDKDIPKFIGREGKNIDRLQSELGIHIDVEKTPRNNTEKKSIHFEIDIGRNISIILDKRYSNKDIDIYCGEEFLVRTKVSKKGIVRFRKNSQIGNDIIQGIKKGKLKLMI